MTLRFNKVYHRYGEQIVLKDLDLRVNPGQITCLLGPSGGGKSTLLRLAAGLETLQAGEISINDQILASSTHTPPPEKRPVGLMFQENALFPHMTVEQNVAFGIQHFTESERKLRVNELLAMVDLADYGNRYPHQLSGGQQQRIALIRSLAPKPQVLLMDEPYASIDITLRRPLREAARRILKQSNTTTIVVTHEPSEAMEMADDIAILDQGKVLQQANPETIFLSPASPAVAAFFGDAQTISAEFNGKIFVSDMGTVHVSQSSKSLTQQLEQGSNCTVVIRPTGLRLAPSEESDMQVVDLRYVGNAWLAFVANEEMNRGNKALRVALPEEHAFSINDHVALTLAEKGAFVFPN